MRTSISALLVCACGGGSSTSVPPARVRFPETCDVIARDLETLARQYAQLASYRAVDQKNCHIHYEHETDRPQGGAGWSGATPHPRADGIWVYIGIYDPNGPEAQLQIHTQPGGPEMWIGSRKVTVLIKEGEQTTKASAAIFQILEKHGLQTR